MSTPRPHLLALLLASSALAPGLALAQDEPGDEEEEGEVSDDERQLEAFELPGESPEPDGPYHQALRPFAALALGANLPLDELELGAQARLALGAQLPILGGRLLPSLELGGATASGSGSLSDERLPDGDTYRWGLMVRQLELGGGLRLRAMRGDAQLSPELSFAAHAVRVHSVLSGAIGAAQAQPVHELGWAPGWRAAGGVSVEVGPGALLIELGYRSVPLEGVIAGDTSLRGLVAGLGYRGTP
jgi:hypothetical protein